MSQTLTYVMGGDRRAHVDNIQDFKVDFSDDNHNWVQARQFERGMRQVFVNIVNEDGTPFDLTGCNVWFEGLLPKTADGDFRVIDDDGYVPLDPSAGKFRYDMPGHAFTVAGSYRQAFFRILKNNNSVTTLEFDLDVLADKVIDGLVPRDWIGPFDKIADQLVENLQKHTDDADKILADFQKKVGDLIAQLNQQGSTTTSMLTELQNRITDLETKIKQDGLFTQAEADAFESKINSLVDQIKSSVDQLKMNNELFVNNYGAKADGSVDDTASIQKAINAFKEAAETTLVFKGTYKVSRTGDDKDGRSYALLLDNLKGKVIDLTNAHFETELIDTMPNIFSFHDGERVTVIGGYAEGTGMSLTDGVPLYCGYFIYGKNMTDFNVYRTHSHNMMGGVCTWESQHGHVKDNRFEHSLSTYKHEFQPSSAILAYTSRYFNIANNDIYGGLRDGDLSVFGAGSYYNVVTGNHLESPTTYAEAITIDGGTYTNIVTNNIIDGLYNYGIDIKYNAANNLVSNNTIQKCAVAIASRGNETNTGVMNYESVIHDNNILLGALEEGLTLQGFKQVGIWVRDQRMANIRGNHITPGYGFAINNPVCGILASQDPNGGESNSQIAISSNSITFTAGLNDQFSEAPKGSVNVYLENIQNGHINSNDVKASISTGSTPIMVGGTNGTLTFDDNNFMNSWNVNVIQKADANAKCNQLNVINNNLFAHNDNDITDFDVYQTSLDYHNLNYIIKNRKFGKTQANNIISFEGGTAWVFLITVTTAYSYEGLFSVDSTYKAYQAPDGGLTFQTVDENNSGVAITGVSLGTNAFAIAAQAMRDCPDTDQMTYTVNVSRIPNNVTVKA